jgi:hypothetical protein
MMLMSVIGKTEEAVSGAAWGGNVLMPVFGGAMLFDLAEIVQHSLDPGWLPAYTTQNEVLRSVKCHLCLATRLEVIGMSDAGLDRVRADLEIMKQAAGTELPFGREDLKWGWIHGLVFVPLAVWSWLGPGTYMSLAIVLSLLATVPGVWVIWRRNRRQRDEHPSRWREHRRETLLSLAIAPPGYLLCVWAIVNGTPPNTMVGLILAVGGGVGTIIGLLSGRRRYYIGMGIAMIACGLVMPGATDQQVGLAMALMFIVGVPVSTAIAAWQLRVQESGHAIG